MKKVLLIVLAAFAGLFSFGQPLPNNVDIGLSGNGFHGSNASSGALVEVILKPLTQLYGAPPTQPVAEDFGVIIRAPKTSFTLADNLQIVQYNGPIFGATTSMTVQPTVDLGPTDPYLYYQVTLLGTGLDLSSLTFNNWSFAFTFKFSNAKTWAQYSTLALIDGTNNGDLGGALTTLTMTGVNQLTNAAFSTLPVSLLNFSGYKNGTKNTLRWTSTSELNNKGYEVQRSSNGTNYAAIGYVNSQAPGGVSSSNLTYTFDDLNGSGRKQFYRLKQDDLDGRSKLSEIVVVNGDKPRTLSIVGLFPNPATTKIKVLIDAPKKDNVTLLVMDISGKTLKQQSVNVDIGSNTVPVDISSLAKGSYLVKIVCQSSDCEATTGKFTKQ